MNILSNLHTRVAFYIFINPQYKKKVLIVYFYLAYLTVISFYFHSNHNSIEFKYKKYNS